MDFFEFRQLNEAFDKPYKFTSRGLGKKQGSVSYNFETEVDDPRFDDPSEVDVYFDYDKEDDEPNYTIVFERNASESVTGEGDAMRIFATVIAIVKEFVKKRNPELMKFSAFKDVMGDDDSAPGKGSREKLYARMLQRYAGKMGYKYSKVSGAGKTEFELRRK